MPSLFLKQFGEQLKACFRRAVGLRQVRLKHDDDGLDAVENRVDGEARKQASAVSPHHRNCQTQDADGGDDADVIVVLKNVNESEQRADGDDCPERPRAALHRGKQHAAIHEFFGKRCGHGGGERDS